MTMSPSEFEVGEDVTDQYEKGRAPGMVVSVRLNRADAERLLAFAESSDRTVSQVARMALRAFLEGVTAPHIDVGQVTILSTELLVFEQPHRAYKTFGAPSIVAPSVQPQLV